MDPRFRAVLEAFGFTASPFGDAGFRWADGHTAVYVERCERTGRYMVTTYRPYGTQTFHRGQQSARDAVALALAETTADRRIGRVAVPA